MKTLLWIQIIVSTAASVVSAGTFSQECRVRFEDNDVCACSTHDPLAPVKCQDDNHSIEIQPCYCMYYDQHLNMTIVGHCFYNCHEYSIKSVQITISSELNSDICNQHNTLHRKGRFCGECNDTYGLAVYSYQYISCVPCQHYGYKNWLKYFAIALLPLTAFYILAVLLSFNVTSSSLNGAVLVIQCITAKELMQLVVQKKPLFDDYFNRIVSSIVCVTNLDFFRWVYPPFCLHPKATILEVLSLDYIVALYPFLLILLTYGLVTAYDKQYRLLVWTWKPFKMCINRYQRTWDIRTSLIEIFATFILLSSVKILGVSFQILAFTNTFNVAGEKLNHYLTLHDANVEYFGSQHLPFALLAIAISSIFVLLPLLLLAIYPCGCFQRCLNRCGLTCRTLHVFMDAFQGSYRTQPRDMRYFSAFYLLLRVLMLVHVQIPLRLYTYGILSLMSAGIVTIFQPYKVASQNAADSVVLMLMGIYFISIHESTTSSLGSKNQLTGSLYQSISILVLVGYFITLLLWKMLRSPIKTMIKKIKGNCANNNTGEAFEWFDRNAGNINAAYPPLLKH